MFACIDCGPSRRSKYHGDPYTERLWFSSDNERHHVHKSKVYVGDAFVWEDYTISKTTRFLNFLYVLRINLNRTHTPRVSFTNVLHFRTSFCWVVVPSPSYVNITFGLFTRFETNVQTVNRKLTFPNNQRIVTNELCRLFLKKNVVISTLSFLQLYWRFTTLPSNLIEHGFFLHHPYGDRSLDAGKHNEILICHQFAFGSTGAAFYFRNAANGYSNNSIHPNLC